LYVVYRRDVPGIVWHPVKGHIQFDYPGAKGRQQFGADPQEIVTTLATLPGGPQGIESELFLEEKPNAGCGRGKSNRGELYGWLACGHREH
jgi:hypothetical protein